MGACTLALVGTGGVGGSAALPVRPDNASPVGGASQMQGGRAVAATDAQSPLRQTLVQITPSSSYATGGDTCDWTSVGIDSTPIAVIPLGVVSRIAASLRVLEYDHDNSKAILRQCGGSGAIMSQPTATTDESALSFYALVIAA